MGSQVQVLDVQGEDCGDPGRGFIQHPPKRLVPQPYVVPDKYHLDLDSR